MATGEFVIQHQVKLAPQYSLHGCWRAVAQMLLRGREPSVEGVALGSAGGLLSDYGNMQTFARVNGFRFHGTMTWSEDGLRRLLVFAPLGVFGRVPEAHGFVIGGMRSTPTGAAVKIYDPSPLWVGAVYEGLYSKMMTMFPMATMYVLQPILYRCS